MSALRAGDLPGCAARAELATRIEPRRAEPWLLLCAALSKMGSVDDERAMADALANIPADEPARVVLESDRAAALARRGHAQEAVDILVRLEAQGDIPARQRDMIGSIYAMVNLFDRALPHCEAAAAALPDNPVVQYNLGTALRYLGRFAEAEAALERSIALDPDHSLAHGTLAAMARATPERNHVERLRAARPRSQDQSEDRARFDYALFKELDDLRRTDEAWAALASGAETLRQIWPFRREQKTRNIDALIATFDERRMASGGASPPSAPTPIFIVGLPRSGTTLTERILASHSTVSAMGETSGFPLALRQTLALQPRKEIDAEAIRALSATDFSEVGRRFLDNTRFLHSGAPFVTEKLPHNYEWVGLIRLAFPRSPIVHVQRAPMDSLFGAFKLQFGADSYTWSYGMSDLATNYHLYRRLMDHWRNVVPGPYCEITLETLIDSPETEIRRLLDACGLPFEPACLTPHETEGGVSTASAGQVRNPINRQGVGAWRRYATQLEPLRAALERDGFVDRNGDPV